MEAIAAFIHADPRTFAEHYCRLSGGKPVLAQRADGYCVFWDRTCTIHPVKPRMCRRWPFIESILVDSANWLAMAGSCPGMRTGIPLREVRACVAKVLASEGPEEER
jgi:Fe-S-cluster containining protein